MPSASTQQVYNSNSVQYGSSIQTIKSGATTSGATTVGTYILENLTVTRPTKTIDRPDEIGGDNGWVAVGTINTGNCVIQMGPNTDKWPKPGHWFEATLDADVGVERWVILESGIPYEMNGYYKVNATLRKDKFRS